MKLILFAHICLFMIGFTACAQQNESNKGNTAIYTDSLSQDQDLGLTPEQKEKIRTINRNIDSKFEEIGRNVSLSGYEKGQKKRALALQHKKEIFNILTAEQKRTWEQKYGHEKGSIKNKVTNHFDQELEKLENRYEADKKTIEQDRSLSKSEKKTRLEKLKNNYKNEKEKLKATKEKSTSSGLLEGR